MTALSRTVLCEGRSTIRPMPIPTRGRRFMGGHSPLATHPEEVEFSVPFFCLLFFGKDAPEGSPLGGQRKVGAAPHRSDANKPKAKQGKEKTKNKIKSEKDRRTSTPSHIGLKENPFNLRKSSLHISFDNIDSINHIPPARLINHLSLNSNNHILAPLQSDEIDHSTNLGPRPNKRLDLASNLRTGRFADDHRLHLSRDEPRNHHQQHADANRTHRVEHRIARHHLQQHRVE